MKPVEMREIFCTTGMAHSLVQSESSSWVRPLVIAIRPCQLTRRSAGDHAFLPADRCAEVTDIPFVRCQWSADRKKAARCVNATITSTCADLQVEVHGRSRETGQCRNPKRNEEFLTAYYTPSCLYNHERAHSYCRLG